MIGLEYKDKLTNREVDVLRLIALGWSNQEIAEFLNIEIRTVKYHTTNIYAKLGVKSRSKAIVVAWMYETILSKTSKGQE